MTKPKRLNLIDAKVFAPILTNNSKKYSTFFSLCVCVVSVGFCPDVQKTLVGREVWLFYGSGNALNTKEEY